MEQSTRFFSRSMGRWLMALMLVMLSSLATRAAEAYACYTSSNKTLTFYYDFERATRPGTIYDLNTSADNPEWKNDGTYANVLRVVFDPSFIGARPSSTHAWFDEMLNLNSITGTEYLNTRDVHNMGNMFHNCSSLRSLDLSRLNTRAAQIMASMFEGCEGLTSLDLSSFNTGNVYDMKRMFANCSSLKTIIVSSKWITTDADYSSNMFQNCFSLVGGQGTTYDANHVDRYYANIDGGPSYPGYLTAGKEAYVIYVQIPKTLTFYYDDQRSSRSGWKYDLNVDNEDPVWPTGVKQVTIDPSFADYRPQTTFHWFAGMSNIQSITGINYLNTSLVENMSGMFKTCTGLTSLDVSSFNTSNVRDMSEMFSYCTNLTSLDVSHFNTANVTDMHSMFNYCRYLTSLDLSHFSTFKVTDMSKMFYGCSNLTTIYPGSKWSTAAVAYSSSMFEDCTSLVGGMGTTYDENHVDAEYAHIDGGTADPGYFTAPTKAYACYTPSNTTLTFYYDNLRHTRTGKTYDLVDELPDWHNDLLDQSTMSLPMTRAVFDPSFASARPTSTWGWFAYMTNLQSITGMEYLNTSEVTNMTAMFMLCSGLTSLDVSHFNTANVTYMNSMFYGCSGLTSLDLSNFNTSNVTYMNRMFYGCTGLTSLDLSNFNTGNVNSMSGMFYGCTGLTSLDVSNFNTSNVTTMGDMFCACSSLTSLDLSSFNTQRVIDMEYMFYSCTGLRTIYVSDGWTTVNVRNSDEMFRDCINLVGGQGTAYNAANVNKTYARIDGGPYTPGYFTEKPAFTRGDVNGDGQVKINDVTALINYLLSHDASSINLQAADTNQNGSVNISDATALINFLLSGMWP